MMISDITKYFLFFIFNITLNSHRVLTSYLERCGQTLKPNDYETLIGPVCSNNYLDFLTCIERDLNKSTLPVDKRYLNSNDFTNIEKKTSKFCLKYKKNVFKKADCDTSYFTNVTSSNFCMNDHVRLEYLKLDKCPINVRMSWFAYRDSAFRHGCKMIDPWYQIIPRYGPEVVCYQDFIDNFSDTRTDNTSLIDVSEKFCRQFKYEKLFSCVKQTISKVNHREFGGPEKKKKHECAANMFVEKRREFCKRFNQEVQKPQAFNVEKILKCKKMVAETRITSMDTMATKYLKCLRLERVVVKLIHDNLMSSRDIDMCRANSSYFEHLISQKNRAGFRFSMLEHLLLIFVILTFEFM